jgi:hypothetical protein
MAGSKFRSIFELFRQEMVGEAAVKVALEFYGIARRESRD